MADTHKDLDYLRFYYSSEESLKDKDLLKSQAYLDYQTRVAALFSVTAFFQVAQISTVNRASHNHLYKYFRHLKIASLIGGFASVWYEKMQLEKKWTYYDRFYPEPTQLQRSLVNEAYIYKIREEKGIKDEELNEKQIIDPETSKIY